MRYRVLIRAFTLRRDVAVFQLVKEYLQLCGCEVRVASLREFDFFLKLWKPHATIVNTVGAIKKVHGVNPQTLIIHWPGEGAESDEVCDATLLEQEKGSFEKLSLLLAWGKMAMDQFEAILSQKDCSKIHITGNPRLDLVKYVHKKAVQHSIGFIGRFNSLNHVSGQSTLYSLRGVDLSNYDSIISQMNGFMLMIETAQHVLKHTKSNVSFRPHPLESTKRFQDDVLREFDVSRTSVDGNINLVEWIIDQQCTVTPLSSSYLEHYLLETPMICTDGIAGNIDYIKKIQPTTALGAKVSYVPTCKEELMELVNDSNLKAFSKNDEVENLLNDGHHYYAAGSAIAKGCAEIMNLLEKKAPSLTFNLPTFLCNLADYYKLSQAKRIQPYHLEMNYSLWDHPTNPLSREIAQDIFKTNMHQKS